MKPKKETYGRDHLLHAWLQGRRYRNAARDLKDYYGKVAMAYAAAFKVDLDKAPDTPPSDKWESHEEQWKTKLLHGLFRSATTQLESLSSPFSGYLTAPKEISDLHQAFSPRIHEGMGKLISAYEELMIELIGKIWGITESHKVSQSELDQCGYPAGRAPDPDDYW